METVLLASGTLTRLVVIKSTYYWAQGYAHRNDDAGGFVGLGEQSAFSPLAKIAAERAKSNERYVNLRFCHSNKYWARKADDQLIVAESNEPEEDTTKLSCTLFEVVTVAGGVGWFYLNHVQSGGRLMFKEPSFNFYVNADPGPTQGILEFVNWDALVKLPRNVAFKGYNSTWLGGARARAEDYPYLQFSFDDPNSTECEQEIHLMDDGHVRIKSKYYDRFWRRSPNWIWADSTDTTADNKDTLFWPVKIDETTIALRNAGNNHFCKRLSTEGKENCLNAADPSMTNEARLVVQELVLGRKIFNVRYWVENARIYNETLFAAGTTTASNHAETPAAIAVEVSYQDAVSQTFSHSLSVTAGVKIKFEAGVPFIGKGGIEVGVDISKTMEWNETTAVTKSVKATGTVPVPARSKATVTYVGTVATCDVPFSYTQADRSSIDGTIIEADRIDGIFTGVNSYNFSFVVKQTEPL